jgi:hypothetical protein
MPTLDRILELRRSGQPDTLPPPSGYFDPATGNPIPTAEIGNYSFVKDAQGVFRSVTIVTDPLGEQFYEFNVADPGLLRDLGFLPKEGGTGRAPPAFSSTQAAQTQAETFQREQDEARRRFEEEQAGIDRELRLRESRLATARDLVGIRSAEAREARTQGVQLAGEDFGRFIAIARGRAGPTGTTPTAAFKQDLAQAGSFQAPDLTGLDTNALESVIGKLSQSITPQGAGTFGFKHGGTFSFRGAAQTGGGAVAFDVGEPIDGLPNPETVILRPDGTGEVVQKIGAAQFGGEFDLGGFESLFRRLRGSTGLTGSVLGAGTDVRAPLLRSEASRLGAFQRAPGTLLTSPETSTVFVVDETGALRPFTNNPIFQQSGFRGQDVQTIPAHQLARFRGGAGISDEPFSLPEAGTSSFQAFGQPLNTRFGFQDLARATPGFSSQDATRISNLIGFLPAPFKIPSSFFQALLPAEKQALISAYRLSGVPEEDFNHLLTAPQLSFAPQRATAVG